MRRAKRPNRQASDPASGANRPRAVSPNATRHASIVAQACRSIEEADEVPSLDDLANSVGMSSYHFHRVFKAHTELTPKGYAAAHRARRVRDELTRSATVTEAIYGAGFNSNSRFYESSTEVLGMTPTTFRSGGDGVSIRFAIGECWLGSILVAASDKGICAILLGDDPDDLARDLQDQFPKAQLIGGDAEFERLVAKVVGFVATPSVGLDIPLGQGQGVIFPVYHRPVQGTRSTYRVNLRHGVSRLRSGSRHTIGIIFHDAT